MEDIEQKLGKFEELLKMEDAERSVIEGIVKEVVPTFKITEKEKK